jgi:flagellin
MHCNNGAARQKWNLKFIRRNEMALTVATNTGALMAQAAASSVNKEMETSMERLSTGKRINAASDDAAGVAIASRLTAEIKGTNMALRNAMDGQALIDTAEGAHIEVENILQRMRELAVQAVNDTNSNTDRTYLQNEISQLTTEIDRIANTTTWAGTKLLNGDFANKNFQVGSGSGSANQIATTIDAMNSASIGDHRIDSTAVAVTHKSAADTKSSNSFVLTGSKGASTISFTKGDGVKTVAAAVNTATSSTGVTAQAVTHARLDTLNSAGTVSFTLTGASGTGTAISASIVNASDLTNLRDAINQVAGTTGITAKFGATNATIDLTDHDGDDIHIDNFASTATNATMQVTALDFAGTTEVGSAVNLQDDISSATQDANITGTLRLTDTQSFTVRTETETDGSTAPTAKEGYFSATSGTFSGGAAAQADSALSAVSAVNIGTAAGAKNALDILDGALRMVATQRGELGAISNRIDSTVNNLTNIVSNLQAGKGRIEDADFAAETTTLAKTQILQQASTAMLAQANASKQNVLSLLQG